MRGAGPAPVRGSARLSGPPAFVPWFGMADDTSTHPYSLIVLPSQRSPERFEWAIRKHGNLAERSDRSYPSEQSAREDGQAVLERQLRGGQWPARRSRR